MNHEVTRRSFGRPDANDAQPVVADVSPEVEAETVQTQEEIVTNAPEGVDEAPALPVDESPAEEAPEVEVAPTEE